jgi:hypothetical protein
VGIILTNEAASELARFEALAAEYRKTRIEIVVLANLFVGTRNKPGGAAVGLSQCRDKLNIP